MNKATLEILPNILKSVDAWDKKTGKPRVSWINNELNGFRMYLFQERVYWPKLCRISFVYMRNIYPEQEWFPVSVEHGTEIAEEDLPKDLQEKFYPGYYWWPEEDQYGQWHPQRHESYLNDYFNEAVDAVMEIFWEGADWHWEEVTEAEILEMGITPGNIAIAKPDFMGIKEEKRSVISYPRTAGKVAKSKKIEDNYKQESLF